MEHTSPIFTETFNFCKNNFFPESNRQYLVMGELMKYIVEPKKLPKPTECGIHKIRVKAWLPETNVFVYYWNYGRVWEFYGMIENGNDHQLEELNRIIEDIEKNGVDQ